MSKSNNSFFSGVFLLTLSGVAVKICGLLFKIPLVSIIGEEGMGYFSSAYVIYTFFYVLSSSGLPVGLSILVANAHEEEKRGKYLAAALIFFGVSGLLLCLSMMLFPEFFASLIGNEGAASSIAVLGPTLLFVCLSGALRGYFQGLSDMQPTALSQMAEAFFKVFLGLFLAYLTVKSGKGRDHASAMALSGILVGSIVSFLYLSLKLLRHYKKNRTGMSLPKGEHYKQLFSVVLPVSASSVVMSISSVVDLTVIMRRLQHGGYSQAEANYLYGSYTGLAVPLFNLPSVLIAPIASAVVPFFITALSKKQEEEKNGLSEISFRLSMMVSCPGAMGLAALAYPITAMLFGSSSAENAAPLLEILAPSVIFVALSTVNGALLQGLGKRKLPVISVLIGSLAKMAVGYFLIGRYGIVGAPIGTLVCYFISALINLIFCVRYKLLVCQSIKTFVLPLVGGALCGGVAKLFYQLLSPLGNTPAVLLAVLLAAGIYLAFLVVTGTANKNIMKYMPIGNRKTKKNKI